MISPDLNRVLIGTRGSELALRQAELLRDGLLTLLPSLDIQFVTIVTTGDKRQGLPSASKGDKKDWVFEIEKSLLKGECDIAIHSSKDVPLNIEPETEILPVFKRATPFDALCLSEQMLAAGVCRISDLPQGSTIGSSSLRRRAQLLRLRPDLNIVPCRGNVPTRLRKIEEEKLDGIVLAAAGLERLGVNEKRFFLVSPTDILPAVNQGILAVQLRQSRTDIRQLVSQLIDRDTEAAWIAERGFVSVLEADCDSALSVFGETKSGLLELSARVLSHEGDICIEQKSTLKAENSRELGKLLGENFLARGAYAILHPDVA